MLTYSADFGALFFAGVCVEWDAGGQNRLLTTKAKSDDGLELDSLEAEVEDNPSLTALRWTVADSQIPTKKQDRALQVVSRVHSQKGVRVQYLHNNMNFHISNTDRIIPDTFLGCTEALCQWCSWGPCGFQVF